MKNFITIIPIILFLIAGCKPINSQKRISTKDSAITVKTLEERGGRLALSPDGLMIAFDKRGKDKYYDIWTMTVEGKNKKCLTCDNPDLPTRNVGQPEWHPSGKYLIVQAEKQEHFEGIATKLSANPGAGLFNDLWAINYKTKRAWLIHEVPDGKQHGVLHPHFSRDGKKLSWSQSYKAVNLRDPAKYAGSWNLKVADVKISDDGKMSLQNIQTFQPGDEVFYENHGFSPDGKKLIFTSNLKDNQSLLTSDIYTLELKSKKLNRLTTVGYNEHAQFSPDGRHIIWMSTNGNIEPEKVKEVAYTDWWIMKADGSEKKRITYLNKEGHPHFVVWGTTAADFDWSKDGKKIFGYYHTLSIKNLLRLKLKESIVSVELDKQSLQ